MDNTQNGFDSQELEGKTFKDYIQLVRNNLVTFLLILILCTAAGIFYAINKEDIYVSSTSIKISKSGGNILESPIAPSFGDFGSDRFIANEIEILKSHDLRERVRIALVDSFNQSPSKDDFELLYQTNPESGKRELAGDTHIEDLLKSVVDVEQKRGLDIIDISVESPSPREAALIASVYASIYRTYNLEINRDQLTYLRNFLDQQRAEKKSQLNEAEDTLRSFQERGGIIALDEQAQSLISQLSQFEAQLNAARIELSASNEILSKYKDELAKQDPKLAEYLESVTSETYITALQNQISELQLSKDLALAKAEPGIDVTQKVKEYDLKITELKQKLDDKIKILKSGIFASSPEEVRRTSQKIIEEEVKNQSLVSQISSLGVIVRRYEERFNRLPKTTIEFARFKRTRESTEKLYTLVEEKYQEALINEQSQPGNVLIIDNARVPDVPAKPNRMLLMLIGLGLGFALAFGYVLTREYFDDTIKSPEDIEKKNVNVLAWIPRIVELNGVPSTNGSDFILEKNPSSIPSESIRALRTRVQFSKLRKDALKTILVTSPAPQEGKSTIALNLAGSFAHSNRRTLLIDADLRKPRLHNVFKKDKEPGLVNYLFGEITYEQLLHETYTRNLFLMTSGTIAPNPSEVLDSVEMDDLLKKVKAEFDYVIIDAPPIVAVTDAEILARKVDGAILVVSADKTEKNLLDLGIKLIKNEDTYLIGTVLNRFSARSGYGSYYKYYYYYSPDGKRKVSTRKKTDKKS
jgi:tyrosine-protein kinase Etk/Wzc